MTVAIRASTGELITASSVRARTAGQAEEMAIAAAVGLPGTRTVLSDSKTAVRNFARGVVWSGTARLAESLEASRAARQDRAKTIVIKWFPAHAGRELAPNICNRNEEADAAARDLATCRAAADRPPHLVDDDEEDKEEEAKPLVDYGGVLRWHRDQRRTFPPPHRELSRAEATKFRQLQTETVLTPALARHVCPELYESATCSVCELETATLAHIMWGCNSAVRDGGTMCCARRTHTLRKCACAWVPWNSKNSDGRSSGSKTPWRSKGERGSPIRLPLPAVMPGTVGRTEEPK